MTSKQKSLLRNYWRATYPAVQIRGDGSVWAKKSKSGAYGLLETPQQAARSALALETR